MYTARLTVDKSTLQVWIETNAQMIPMVVCDMCVGEAVWRVKLSGMETAVTEYSDVILLMV